MNGDVYKRQGLTSLEKQLGENLFASADDKAEISAYLRDFYKELAFTRQDTMKLLSLIHILSSVFFCLALEIPADYKKSRIGVIMAKEIYKDVYKRQHQCRHIRHEYKVALSIYQRTHQNKMKRCPPIASPYMATPHT